MRILMILSEATVIEGVDGTTYDTGYWLEEFAIPYKYFLEQGYELSVATPTGKVPVPDPASTEVDSAGRCKNWETPRNFEYGLELHEQLVSDETIHSLTNLFESDLNKYDGVFVPGGYAPMVDLSKDAEVGRILWHFHRRNMPTGLFCHGPIALLSTTYTPEGFAYSGYKVTSFSTTEEQDTDFGRALKEDAQTLLTEAGCLYEKGKDWSSHTVRDRELITGQNTQSTHAVMTGFVSMFERGSAQ